MWFPAQIGRYELLLPIGTGGMGTVYLARSEVVPGLQREVAVKLLHRAVLAGDHDDQVKALLEEARLAVHIKHPNVVRVIEAAVEQEGAFIAMELVEGDTLGGLMRAARSSGSSIPLPIAGRIFADALSGLHAAHEQRDPSGQPLHIVHRDFTPSNILVGVDGVTRLTDFGIARATSRQRTTATGQIRGNVGYMSPEQLLGKPLDRRSDVWSAGVVAWELLAERRMYGEADEVARLVRVLHEPPPPLRRVRPDLPGALVQPIHAALIKSVHLRCSSAAELQERLVTAWQAAAGIADSSEVADYVKRVTAQKHAKIREQVAEVDDCRNRIQRASQAAIVAARKVEGPGSSRSPQDWVALSDSGVSGPSPFTTAIDHPVPAAPRSRGRRAAAVVVAGMVTAGALLVGFASRQGAVDFARSAWSGAANPGDHSADAALPAVLPAGSGSRVVPRMITIRANAAIARVQFGELTVAVARPAPEIELPFVVAEGAATVRLQANTADGREAAVTVDAGAAEAELTFPDRAQARARRPARSATAASSTPPTPKALRGLAPSPYRER